jgi:hypothetical protein
VYCTPPGKVNRGLRPPSPFGLRRGSLCFLRSDVPRWVAKP